MTQPLAGFFRSGFSGYGGAAGYMPAYLTWKDDAGIPHNFQCFVKTEDYDFGADITEHPVETGSTITDNVRVKLREAKISFFETNTPIDANNWIALTPTISVITVTAPGGGIPNPPQPPLEFESWNNLITERALGATATGAIGNLIGGTMGGAVGTVVGEVVGDAVVGGGIPVPQIVFPPPDLTSVPAIPLPITSQATGVPPGTVQDFVALTIQQLQDLLNNVQVVDLVAPKLEIDNMVIQSIRVHRDEATGDAAEIDVGLKEIRFVTTISVPAPAPTVVNSTPAVNKGEQGSANASGKTQSVAVTAAKGAKKLASGVAGVLGIGGG
jgi:hypothetical protein